MSKNERVVTREELFGLVKALSERNLSGYAGQVSSAEDLAYC